MLAGILQVHQGQVGPVDPDPEPPPLPGGAAEVVRAFMDVPQGIQIGGAVLAALVVVAAIVLGWRHRGRIRSWTSDLPVVVKASAAAVVVAGGAAASVAGYRVYDFVEHDNRFCTGCHVMADAFLRFEESPHAELGCKECHAQPRTESARQLYLWVLERPEEVGPHSPVPDARCTSCHIDEDPVQWPQIAASLGHRVHFESDDPELGELMCVTCHGVSVHEFSPAEATCGECHEGEATIRLGAMAAETELHCVACHDFLAEEPSDLPGAAGGMALLPDRAQCRACHEMGDLLVGEELDADPHGAVCGACHNPHVQDAPGDAVETCLGCHEQADTLTVFHTGTHAPVLPHCTECHSAHSWRVEGSDCLSCHETVLEEPTGGMSWEGAGLREGGTRVGFAATLAPVNGEAGEGSRPNGGSPPPSAVPSRPWALQVLHGGGSPPGTDAKGGGRHAAPFPPDTLPQRAPRPFLHREHVELSCTECHGRADEHGVVTVRTAEQCAACHHDPGRAYACQDCHALPDLFGLRAVSSPMTLTVWDEPRSRALPFDHALHEALECQECHTRPVMLAVETECAACHDDHHRPRADCAQCHVPAEPGVHGLEVHLTCTSAGCHAGEAGERPALTRTFCLACHSEERDHEPGLDCQTCHMVPAEPPTRRSPSSARPPRGAPLP